MQQPRWTTLERKEARLRADQVGALSALRRRITDARQERHEIITDNTLICVAVDFLLHHGDSLGGDTEEALLRSVATALPPLSSTGWPLRPPSRPWKKCSLVVPVLLGPGETADNMLTSRAYGGLAKPLEALRAHDARIVETLAEQQAPSRYKPVSKDESGKSTGQGAVGAPGASAPPPRPC